MDERNLADALGISRNKLRLIRSHLLEAPADWERGHGGRIEYTEAGIERAKTALASGAVEDLEANAKNSPPEALEGDDTAHDTDSPEIAPPATESPALPIDQTVRPIEILDIDTAPRTAHVVRCFRNRRILEAEIDGRTVLVRVKDNSNFIRRMEIPVVPDGTAFRLFGKLPRWKGRW